MPRVPVPGPSGLCPGANVFGLQYPDRATKQEGPPGLCSGEFFHAKVSTQGNSASSHSLERRGTPLSSASDPEPFCLSWKPSNTSFPYTAGPRALASPAWGIGAVGVPGDRSQLVVSVVSLDGRVLAAYADGSALLLHRNIRCCSVFTPSRANSPCRDASSGHILSAFPPLHSRGALPAKDRSGQPASRGRGLVVSRFLCSYVTDPVLRTRIGHAVSLRNRFLPRVVRAEDQCTAHSGGCRRRSGPLFCLSTSAMDNQNCLCNGSIQEPSFSVAVSPEPLLCSPPVAGQFPGSLSHASSAQRKVFSLSKYTDVHWPCLSVSCRDRVLSLLHISLQCVLRAAGLYLSRSPQEHLSSKLRQVGASEFFRNGPVGGEPSTVAAASEPALQAAGVIRLLRHARRQLQAVQGLFKRLSGFVCIRETGDVLVNAMVTGGTAICRSRGSRNGALWSDGAHRPYNETWSGRDAAKKDGAVVFHRDSSAPPCSEICGAGRVRRGWDLSQQYSLEVCLVLHPSARFVSTKWPACTSSRRTVVPLRACTPDYHAMLRDELLVGNSSISPPSSRRPPAGCLPMTPIFHQSSVPGVACDGLLPWDDVECSTSPSTSFHSGGRPITNAEITLAYAYEVQEQVFPVTTAAAEQLWAWPLKIAFMGHALHQLQEMLRELSTALTPFEKDESRRHSQEVGIAAEASKSCDTGESASSVVCAPPGAASARTTVQRSPKDAALFPTTPGLPGACGNSLEAIGQALKRVYRRGVHVRRILDDLGRLFLSSDATTFSTSRPSPDRQGTLDFQGARHPGVTAVIKSNAAGRSCVSAESSTEVIGENFGCRASLAVDPPDLLLVSLPLPSVQSAPRSASDLGGWSEEPPMPMDAFLRLADQIKLGGHHDKAASDCHLARDTCAWQVGQHGCGMEICGSSFGGCSAYSCIGGAFCLSKRRGDCRTQREDLRPVLSSTVPSLLSETSVPLASGLCRPRGPPSVRPNSMIDAGCPVLSSLVCVVPSIGTIFLCPTSIAWGCVSCACFCVSAGRQIPEQNIHTHSATDSEAFQLQGCVHDGRACCSDSMNISNSCLWVPFRPCALSDFSQFTSESPSGNDKRSDLGRDLFSDSTDAVGPVPSQHRPFSEAHSRHCPERLPPTGGAPAKSDVCWSLLASPASPRRRTVALQWLPPDRQQGALYTLLSAAEFLAYTQLIRFRHSGIVATLLLEGACALTPGALAAAVNEGKAASAIAEAIPEVVAALQEVDGLQRGETNRVPLGEVSDGDSQWNRNRSGFAKGHGSNLEEVVARGGEEALRVIFEILSVDRKGLTSSGTARSEATAEFTKTEDLNRGCASYFGRRSSSQSTVRMQAALGVEASGRGGPSHCEEEKPSSCAFYGQAGWSWRGAPAREGYEAWSFAAELSDKVALEPPPAATEGLTVATSATEEDRGLGGEQASLSCFEVDVRRWFVQGVGEFVLTKKILTPQYASALLSAFSWARAAGAGGSGELWKSANSSLSSETSPRHCSRQGVIPEYYCLRGTITTSGLCAAVHFSAVQQDVSTGESPQARRFVVSGSREATTKRCQSLRGREERATRVPVACQKQRAAYGRPPHIRSRQEWTVLVGCSGSDRTLWHVDEGYVCVETADAFGRPAGSEGCSSDITVIGQSLSLTGPLTWLEEPPHREVLAALEKATEDRVRSTQEEWQPVCSDSRLGSVSRGLGKHVLSEVGGTGQVASSKQLRLTAIVITHVSVTRGQTRGSELLCSKTSPSDVASLLRWAKEAPAPPSNVSNVEYQWYAGEDVVSSQPPAGLNRHPSSTSSDTSWRRSGGFGFRDMARVRLQRETDVFVEPGETVLEGKIREAVAAVLDCVEWWRQQRDEPAAVELFSELSSEVLAQSRRIDERLHCHQKRPNQKND